MDRPRCSAGSFMGAGSSRTSRCSSDGTFEREDFTYDRESDVYFCPAGKMLTCKGTLVKDGATLMYRASEYDCDPCTLKPRCSPNAPARKIPRSIHEGARNYGARHCEDRCLSDLTTRTEEDRDAVRPPQTHPAAR